jgi:nicotinamide mononucleotide (NMN) deamidase PncC
MKRILEFKAFESLNGLSEEQKGWLDRCTRGSWSIGEDGKVDVEGDFDCSSQRLEGFKWVSFGRVSGSFRCHDNDLTSLKGAPETVGGSFWCYNNRLTKLEGSPETVGGSFWCYSNRLTTLKGSPETVGWSFWCYSNRLTTLEGAPETVGGRFYCNDNNLTSLKGAPETVGGSFWCYNNRLTTLEGAPQSVGGDFYSDSIKIPEGQWGISSWLKVLEEGEPKAQKLIATLISPEALNKRLKESPEQTMVALKRFWNSPEFAKIRSQLMIPKGYEDEMDLLGDLDDIGL